MYSALLLALLLAATLPAHAATLRIAAAANLQKVLGNALIPAFEKATGIAVVPAYGSTQLLAAQITQGAPVDVFVAADTATVDKLARRGALDPATKRVYAVGQLVLWSRRDAPLHPRRLEDLADSRYGRIAIANPALAPYGKAAVESIAHARLTQALAPRLAQAENIAQSLQYARSGNAGVAFTALSLVIDDRADPYLIVPESYHAPIAQAAAVVRSSAQRAAALRFLDFLTSPQARPLWQRYGYALPPAKRRR